MKKYVVIDLEMCAVHNKKNKQIFNSGTELIQIGAVILDQDYRIVDTYSTYVCPEFGSIPSFASEYRIGINPFWFTKLMDIFSGSRWKAYVSGFRAYRLSVRMSCKVPHVIL